MPLLRAVGVELVQYFQFRGSKSRNKVTVGEPAVGSLPYLFVPLKRCRHGLYSTLE